MPKESIRCDNCSGIGFVDTKYGTVIDCPVCKGSGVKKGSGRYVTFLGCSSCGLQYCVYSTDVWEASHEGGVCPYCKNPDPKITRIEKNDGKEGPSRS